MPTPNSCEAVQMSDQMRCERCDLTWDMNDPDRPECKQTATPPYVKKGALRKLVNSVPIVKATDSRARVVDIDYMDDRMKRAILEAAVEFVGVIDDGDL